MVTCDRRRARRARVQAAAQPGHGDAVRERGRRLQRPHDRHPRRDRPGPADEGRRLDGDAPGERRVPRREPRAASSCRPSPTAPCTSTTSTRSGSPRTATASSRALKEEHGVGSGVYYPIPNHRLPSLDALRARARPARDRAARRAEVVSLPVHPSLTRSDLERIVEARQRARRGGRLMAELRAGLLGVGMMGRHHARVLRELDGRRPRRHRRPRRRPARRRRRPRRPARRRRADRRRHRHRGRRGADPLPRGRRAEARRGGRAHARREADRRRRVEAGPRMAEAFAGAGLVGAVGHVERFNPALQELRRRHRGRRRRRGLPDRHAAPGHRSRPASPMSASAKDLGVARHRPHRVGRPERLRDRLRADRCTRAAASTRT